MVKLYVSGKKCYGPIGDDIQIGTANSVGGKMMLFRTGFLTTVTLYAFFVAATAWSAELTAHRAIYDLRQLSGGSGSNFTNVNGKMYLDWSDVCDGWTLTQHVRLNFIGRTGQEIQNDFTFSSWESRDGNEFRYTMRSTTNDELNEQIEGRAELEEGGAGGVALFISPEKKQVPLPPGTLFPTEHLFLTIDHAMAGETVLTANVFSGTGDDSLNEVSAFIGRLIEPEKMVAGSSESELSDSDSLLLLRSWPVAMAYFPYGSGDHEPEFEVHFTIMENGVSPSMDLDYGNFAIRAAMEELEYHLPPDC